MSAKTNASETVLVGFNSTQRQVEAVGNLLTVLISRIFCHAAPWDRHCCSSATASCVRGSEEINDDF